MDLWNLAKDALPDQNKVAGTADKIAYANVLALLAIGQELGRINSGDNQP